MPELTAPVRALVFDLDDTLLPEVEYLRSGFRAVASRLTRPGYDADRVFNMLWDEFEHGVRDRVFNRVLLKMHQADNPQVIAELVSVYRCHQPTVKIDKGIYSLLGNLAKNYKLGIITDGFLPGQKLKVQALQIEQYFDNIIYTEQLGREYWKPAPQGFVMMAKALGVPASTCVYIADNPAKDFIAPRQLGWQSVQINLPQKVHKTTENATISGDLQISNLQELVNLLP